MPTATAEPSPTSTTERAASTLQPDMDVLEAQLGTSAAGLSQTEADRRLQQGGANEIPEEAAHPLRKLASYFWGPIPWMIEIAAILSAVVGHWAELAIIVVLLLANALVGFWEEYQAGNAIAALKARLALKARVKRDGAWRSIAARELVPGDVIRLRLGDIVPADASLRDGGPVEVDQSALTGESLPATREIGGQLFSGSIVKQGETEAVVTATGLETYFGRTAKLVEASGSVSHFQRAVLKIGDYLILFAGAMVLLILAVGIFRGDSLMTDVEFALVLTIAAIPVAMPAVLSVTMAVGARLLAAKDAIVSRLAAIEELAGMDVLCSDKTGTLTKNQLTLGDPFVLPGVTRDELFESAALASRAENEDAIDLAVLSAAPSADHLQSFQAIDFVPFDPVSKRTEATVLETGGRRFKVSKGAPQAIAALAPTDSGARDAVMQAVEGFARHGYRSLAVARAEGSSGWRLLGVLPLYDPPRDDSRATLAAAHQLGVEVKMVTGDQEAIAREIARQLDLGDAILPAARLTDALHHESAGLADAIEAADGFAEVYPEHKHHIVEVLQQRGHIVGMTGDGVNDAPALKKADAGIAVSGATDAARAAADIVLMTPGLSVIVDAIRESRKIFQRMNSYAIYRIAETLRVLLFMTLSILVFNFYPVTAIMIVLLALLNDGPILAIAFDRAHGADQPQRWNMPLVLGVSTVLGVLGVAASFGLFYLAERVFHLGSDVIQSLIFLKLAVAGHLTIFLTRTRGPFWSDRPSSALLWSAVATKALATLAAVYGLLMVPIGWTLALTVWGYSLAWFIVNDFFKRLAYRIFDPSEGALLGTGRASTGGTHHARAF